MSSREIDFLIEAEGKDETDHFEFEACPVDRIDISRKQSGDLTERGFNPFSFGSTEILIWTHQRSA